MNELHTLKLVDLYIRINEKENKHKMNTVDEIFITLIRFMEMLSSETSLTRLPCI